MKGCYEWLRDSVKAYESIKYPDDIFKCDSQEIKSINEHVDKLKDKIFLYALMYIHEMEGEENDL